MSRAPDGPTAAELRAAVQRAVQATSVRATAHRIGMSDEGLAGFLAGASPRASTLRKLLVWHAGSVAQEDGRLPYGMAAAILRLLTEHLPPDRARQVQQQIVADVRRASEAAGVAPPIWVREAEEDSS